MLLPTNTIEAIQIHVFPDNRLDVKNAARYLGLKDKTLAVMRGNATGPRFIKRGHIFYYLDDLNNWLNANGRFISTAQSLSQPKSLQENIT